MLSKCLFFVALLYSLSFYREKDDLPCELCEQLVNHLRDLLVANTTEKEFEKVLLGLCKQTKSFKSECTSIVDEYYPVIYNFLLKELNASYVCGMVGICPSSKTISDVTTFQKN